jgi:hypothetical protein
MFLSISGNFGILGMEFAKSTLEVTKVLNWSTDHSLVIYRVLLV